MPDLTHRPRSSERQTSASMCDLLYAWALRTTGLGELREAAEPAAADRQRSDCGSEQIYRLRQWPRLPEPFKTAKIYRVLSVMSQRPVNRRWMQQHGKLPDQQIDALLQRLQALGALEVIDGAGFEPPRR